MNQEQFDELMQKITEQLSVSLSNQVKARYITGELATGILQTNMASIAALVTPLIMEASDETAENSAS